MENLVSLIALTVVVFIEIFSLHFFRKNQINKLIDAFSIVLIDMIFWCVGLILQIIIINMSFVEEAFYIDCYCVFPFIVFLPIALFFFARAYEKDELIFKKKYILLFVIPIITMIVLITNNKHHLFYEQYSTQFNLTKFGPYNYVHCAFTYGLLALDIYKILKTNIKKHTFFTKQTLLIITGLLIPLVINVIGTFNVIPMSIYITPITFSLTMLFWGIAILKYDFMSLAPIALKKIVDQMSDAYIVLNNNYEISECNKAFEKIFNLSKENIIGSQFSELEINNKFKQNNNKIEDYIKKVQTNNKVYYIDTCLKDESKYFNIEISAITADNNCIGILILFRDTTQHILDMQALKDNQNILMERERLATLGQMVGGIAHNLKTPIMSIAGAMEGMEDLIKEYESSIDDAEVTKEDHHAIAKDMHEWINKVNSYDAYMSDIITSVKGQAVGFNDSSIEEFSIDELIKRVSILMKHELKNNFVELNINCSISNNTIIRGNVNSLVQIVNNLISNGIQSYNDKSIKDTSKIGDFKKVINLNISKDKNNIIISVEDFGCGISKEVQEKLFKSMVTTKGHNGTGLGLFMSYSTIKGKFNGDLNFTSEVGKGTTFNIVIPV